MQSFENESKQFFISICNSNPDTSLKCIWSVYLPINLTNYITSVIVQNYTILNVII